MRIINDINKKLEVAYEDLKNAYRGTVESLRLAVDAKDTYTKNHSDRVAIYSKLIGEQLQLPEDQMEILCDGALFHDIGKIGIPDSILQKPGKLTDEEYDDIKNHPSIGAKIIAPAKIFDPIIPIVKHHHERFDGKGYPSGLKGEEIPLLARIVTVADSFDAMTSDRSYRPRFTLVKALDELENGKGTQFDPELVDAFVIAFKEHREEIEKATEMTYIQRDSDKI